MLDAEGKSDIPTATRAPTLMVRRSLFLFYSSLSHTHMLSFYRLMSEHSRELSSSRLIVSSQRRRSAQRGILTLIRGSLYRWQGEEGNNLNLMSQVLSLSLSLLFFVSFCACITFSIFKIYRQVREAGPDY